MIFDLTPKDFANMFSTDVNNFCEDTLLEIEKNDFRYRKMTVRERDKTILKVIKQIDSEDLGVAGSSSIKKWENGWNENLVEFVNEGYNFKKLTPKYYRPYQIARIFGDFAIPLSPTFDIDFLSVLRLWLFKKYFASFDNIYEFGCGPAHNIAFLSKLFPKKYIHGSDWASSSVDIIKTLKTELGMNVDGCKFDMFNPDPNLKLKKNSVVFTMGSMEQLGDNYAKFVDFLVKNSIDLCIHVEPICEFYNENILLDYLAVKYHQKRKYLSNYMSYLESRSDIEIVNRNRVFAGSFYEEGWSIIVWKLNR